MLTIDARNKTADIIKKTRQELVKTQQEMGELLGIGTRAFANIENGNSSLEWKHVYKLMEVFGCDIGYITGEHTAKRHKVDDVCKETGLSEAAVEILKRKQNIVSGGGNRIDKELRHEDAEHLDVINFIIENHIIETENPSFADPDRENLFQYLYNYLLADGWFVDGGQEVREISVVRASKHAKKTELFGLRSYDLNEIDWRKLVNALAKLRDKAIREAEQNGKK